MTDTENLQQDGLCNAKTSKRKKTFVHVTVVKYIVG